MTDSYGTCRTCHTPTTLRKLEPATGDEKALGVTLHGLNVLVCANGHKHFLDADFPLKLLNHLREEDEVKLPAGQEKGVLMFKHFHCQDCGGELAPQPDHRHSFNVEPGLPEQPELRVDLTMAVYACTACGKEQMHSLSELRKLTPTALVHAFKAAGIQSG